MAVTDWSTTPASNSSSPPNGAPEGMSPASVNDVIRQIMADVAVESQINAVKYLSSVSGTNTITGQMTPALGAYQRGMMIVFTPANNNTAAATLNISSLGALDILKSSGHALAAGDLVAGVPAFLVLDHGHDDWYLLNPQNDVARIAAANVFLDGQLTQAAVPLWGWVSNLAPVNARRWYSTVGTSGQWQLTSRNDAGAVVATPISINHAASTLALAATTVTVNGVNVRDASIISSGQFANARISRASVTQHQAALSIATSQLTGTFPATSLSGNMPNARIVASNVTQHQASLAINAQQVDTAIVSSSGNLSISSSHIERIVNQTGAGTITVGNSHGFSAGDSVAVIRTTSGAVTFAASGSQSILSPGSRLTIPERYGIAVLTYVTTNSWRLSGV